MELLKITRDALDKLKITYWLSCGTLLGAMRNNKLIAWDDDIDIATFEIGAAVFQQLKQILKQNKLQIIPMFFGHKIIPLKSNNVIDQDSNLDIFIVVRSDKDNKSKITFKFLFPRLIWPKEVFEYDEIFPLQKVTLENELFDAPAKADECLSRMFGKDYKTKCLISHMHASSVVPLFKIIALHLSGFFPHHLPCQ